MMHDSDISAVKKPENQWFHDLKWRLLHHFLKES